ncbi:MAG: glycosyltransferase family 2 protein [Pseudomonadota bacterium]
MADDACLPARPDGARAPAAPVAGASVLVAIPTFNEEDHIEACLRSLLTGDDRLCHIRIIVADGESTDATREIVGHLQAEFPNVSLIHNPKRLQSAAVNAVAQASSTPETQYLIRCDAHSIYPPGFITEVADALARTGADSVVVPMDAVGETCFQKANAWIVDTPLGSGGSAHRGGRKSGEVDHGHHAGFKLARFNALGGYDETFSHNEDAEYDQRVANAGGRIYMDADIRLAYAPRATVSALARQYYSYGRGRARNMRKHGTRPRLRQMIPVLNLLGLAGALVGSAIFPWMLAYPAFYLCALGAASLLIAVRHGSLCGLFAGVASGTMHTAWAAGFLRQFVFGSPER